MNNEELKKALEIGEEQYNDLVEENNKLNEKIIELQQENNKQRAILDILTKFINVDYYFHKGVKKYYAYVITNNVNKTVDITKEQYELLKEVKEND